MQTQTSQMGEPLVSICCQTYNHSNFIEEALESFLMQKVDFNYEILLRDDASNDGTAEICKNYAKKYPDKIKLLEYEENQFQKGVRPFIDNVKRANGKYVAFCEGDDYWTDENKLQKEVDFLENTLSAAGCFHNSICVNENNKIINENYFHNIDKESYNQVEVLKILQSSYSTAALVFRTDAIINNLHELKKIGSDFILDVFITEYGRLHYIHEYMSAYRIHAGGIWQGKSDFSNKIVVLERYLFLYRIKRYKERYNKYLWKNIISLFNELINKADTRPKKIKWKLKQLLFLSFIEKRSYSFLKNKINTELQSILKK